MSLVRCKTWHVILDVMLQSACALNVSARERASEQVSHFRIQTVCLSNVSDNACVRRRVKMNYECNISCPAGNVNKLK